MAPTIAALNIHPLKGGTIQPLQEAKIGPYGLLGDRMFMVVDVAGTLISQRNAGKERLALIRAEVTNDTLELSAPGMRLLPIPLSDPAHKLRTVQVHLDTCQAIDCGAAASAWLTAFLGEQNGQPVNLVRFDTRTHRELNAAWYPQNTTGTAFADGAPILVTSEVSLAELNRRIKANGAEPLPMSRFRPNVVLAGLPEPFAEDDMQSLTLGAGAVEIALHRPCERCSVTTVDQVQGARGANPAEPLRTLGEFRRGRHLLGSFPALPPELHGKVFFGIGALPARGAGEKIRVGDSVEVRYREIHQSGAK